MLLKNVCNENNNSKNNLINNNNLIDENENCKCEHKN